MNVPEGTDLPIFRESNQRPRDRQSNILTVTPASHPLSDTKSHRHTMDVRVICRRLSCCCCCCCWWWWWWWWWRWWCWLCTESIVVEVAFTRCTVVIRTRSTSLELTLHRRPTSTPGHATLTLQRRRRPADSRSTLISFIRRWHRRHTTTSTTHARYTTVLYDQVNSAS